MLEEVVHIVTTSYKADTDLSRHNNKREKTWNEKINDTYSRIMNDQ
jgi:uncharacterized membrane protein